MRVNLSTFVPILADPYEPRNGVSNDLRNIHVELFAGKSAELIHWQRTVCSSAAGIEFFTWSLLRRESNFRFPVEAVDYFFGAFLSTQMKTSQGKFTVRLRLSHISAHLVDGAFGTGFAPRVFSREFLSLAGVSELSKFKLSLGGTFLFHTIPDTIGRFQAELGTQLGGINNRGLYTSAWMNLQMIRRWVPTVILKGGYLLPYFSRGEDSTLGSSGIEFFVEYYSGISRYGQLFPQRETRLSLGIIFQGW
ncbi:MAG: hypothetical protein ACP5ON_06775 [Bacteroidota bacterium]